MQLVFNTSVITTVFPVCLQPGQLPCGLNNQLAFAEWAYDIIFVSSLKLDPSQVAISELPGYLGSQHVRLGHRPT